MTQADTTQNGDSSPLSGGPRWLWWAVGGITVLTALGVFALPWLVRAPVLRIASESQAIGFYNRVAIVSLGLACLALLALGQWWRVRYARDRDALHPAVLLDPVPVEERVSPRLVIVLSVVAVALLALIAYVSKAYPYADNSYFVDKLLHAVNGGRFNVDFEFSYGPLFLYPQYLLWLVLRGIGVNVYQAYYAMVAFAEVAGILMAQYLVNRLRMTRRLRRMLFAVIAAVVIIGVPAFGPNYSVVRFALPFVLMVFTLSRCRGGGLAAVLVPVAAVVFALLVSPEVGVVTACALAVGLALRGSRDGVAFWVGAAASLVVGFGGLYGYSLAQGSALMGFASGNANLPVWPGQSAVVYVLMMLAVCGLAGLTMSWAGRREAAAQAAWLTACLIFIVPALGRADWIHLFWNGFGAILLLAALLDTAAPRLAYGFSITIAVLYVVSASTFFLVGIVPQLFDSGVNSGAITRYMIRGYAHRIGRKYSDGTNWWVKARVEEPSSADIERLAQEGGVITLSWLEGAWAERLASAHALQPLYEPPAYIGTEAQLSASLADLDQAKHVLITHKQYKANQSLLKVAEKNKWDVFHISKVPVGGAVGLPSYFPLSVRPANPVLDPTLAFAKALERDWVIDRRSGGYLILRPKN